MEKKIIRRCYGRKYQLVEVPKDRYNVCPKCVFDGKERFCVKNTTDCSWRELGMKGLCATTTLKTTGAWQDITPAWNRLFNWLIGRK